MNDHDIFAALAKVRKGAVALACATRTLVPQLEEDLRQLEACCAGDGAGRAFARAFVDEVVRPVREVVEALRDFVDPFEELPADPADNQPEVKPAAEQPAGEINFHRFSKLKEFTVVEKAIEVVAPLRDKEGSGILRLEALRSPSEPGYMVAVYRQISGLLPPDTYDLEKPEEKPAGVCFWTEYDLIQSNLPTPEKALEQALGFLEMRCD